MEIIKKEIIKSTAPIEIYSFCKAIAPQFYLKKTADEIKQDLFTIDMLTRQIPLKILQKMCEISLKNYPRDKSQDSLLKFDMNYILEHRKSAEYLVRSNLNSFYELFDSPEDINL